mmetsp:Transcript_43122/g.99340  ORF Transcript_43122/g.99340 Transcript_43122/m.99340 type:complete len:95 (+) Transcript_43122:99-383(+)
MAKAVYYKLWATTASYAQRRNYGWYQVASRMAPWAFPVVPGLAWYSFGWWSDEWKKVLTFGIYEPQMCHWDTNMTPARSEFVKYKAEYCGIPYK